MTRIRNNRPLPALPPRIDGAEPPMMPRSRQITLVGANGAGKSLFMEALIDSCGEMAYCLSALEAAFPERNVSERPGSIDMLYAHAVASQPYMKDTAVSEIDKLAFLLFTDELEYLLSVKAQRLGGSGTVELRPTKLDLLASVWRKIFPDVKIVRNEGRLLFSNTNGGDVISPLKLSRGEKAALYYIAAALYAMPGAVVFIENPTLFLHPAIVDTLWNAIEDLRPDCTFVYDTVDEDFVNSRTDNICIWIKSFDADSQRWDYDLLPHDQLTDDLFVELIGSRKPMLFIEGDATHSIDAKLYALVFSNHRVKPLGSCNKVIEVVRSFNDMKPMHHLDSLGIVDRDRRTEQEVEYLRRKSIMVAGVAEVENIFLMENVVKTMARLRGRDPERTAAKVKDAVTRMFADQLEAQALMHVRHRVKREVEVKIDARFTCITALEAHLRALPAVLRPRERYNELVAAFREMVATGDYAGILRVFNHKPALAASGVAGMLGYANTDDYIAGVLSALKSDSHASRELKAAVKHCFGLRLDDTPEHPDSREEPAPQPKKRPEGGENHTPDDFATRAQARRERRRQKRAKHHARQRNENGGRRRR